MARVRCAPISLSAALLRASVALSLVLVAAPSPAARAQGPATPSYLDAQGKPLPFAGPEAVRDFLRAAPIVDIEDLSVGTTAPRRLTLQEGSVRARAVFKTVDETHGALRQGDAAFAAFYDRAIAEVAAYELATLLGIHMVPPAVLREVDGESGAVQLWVEGAMTESERGRRHLSPPDSHAWRLQHSVMSFFDALVYNADRNTGTQLIDGTWQLWLIDHTRAFQRPRGRNEFPAVQQVPGFLWESFLALDEETIRDRLSPYLDGLQLAALLGRRQDLETHVRELIRERGEGAVILR